MPRVVRSRFAFLALCLLTCAQCQRFPATAHRPPSHPLRAPRDSVGAIIARINGLLNKAVVEGDYGTQAAYYSDSVLIDPPFRPLLRGRAALQHEYQRNREDDLRFHSFTTTTSDMWVSDGKAYERGLWGLSMSSRSHPDPQAFHGGYFQIWNLRDSIPLIEYLIYNLDHVPAQGAR
jgi:hypothetical protein